RAARAGRRGDQRSDGDNGSDRNDRHDRSDRFDDRGSPAADRNADRALSMEAIRPRARPARRGPLIAGLLALGLALAAIGPLAGGPAADAAGQKVRRVLVSGDSVTESATLAPADVHSQGLDGALLSALAKRGVPATDGYL